MADEPREDLALDRDRAPGGDQVERLALDHVHARAHLVGVDLARLGLLEEAEHLAVLGAAHEPERRRVVDRVEAERDHGTGLLVLLLERGQVEVGERVAVEDHEAVAEQALVGGEADRPGGAERLVLLDVGDRRAAGDLVAERRPQRARP